MSISANDLTRIMQAAAQQDPILQELRTTASARGIGMDLPAKFAIQVGELLMRQGGKSQEELIRYIQLSFRAALYGVLVQAGVSYQGTRPDVHNTLAGELAQFQQFIQAASQATAGLGLSGGLGTGLGGGLSTGLSASAPQGIQVAAADTAAPSDILTRGVPVPGTQSAGELLAKTIPATPAPVASVQIPAAAPISVNNAKLLQIVGNLMESYKEHELWPEEVRQISARAMNQQVSAFRETAKFSDGLVEALTKVGYKTYEGCELVVIRSERKDEFCFPTAEVYEAVKSCIMNEWVSPTVIALKKALSSDDCEVTRNCLSAVIDRAEEFPTALMNAARSAGSNAVHMSMLQALAAQFSRRVDNMLGYIANRMTANGSQRLATLAVSRGKRLVLDGDRSDVSLFLTDVYDKSAGENGEVTDAAEFRQLFLSGILGLATVGFSFGSDNARRISMVSELVEINIGGDYPSLKKYDVISNQALGATYEPICNIYETVKRELPTAMITLRTPTGYYPLIGSGEVGTNIYY